MLGSCPLCTSSTLVVLSQASSNYGLKLVQLTGELIYHYYQALTFAMWTQDRGGIVSKTRQECLLWKIQMFKCVYPCVCALVEKICNNVSVQFSVCCACTGWTPGTWWHPEQRLLPLSGMNIWRRWLMNDWLMKKKSLDNMLRTIFFYCTCSHEMEEGP